MFVEFFSHGLITEISGRLQNDIPDDYISVHVQHYALSLIDMSNMRPKVSDKVATFFLASRTRLTGFRLLCQADVNCD